ncbi:MAG TPA: polysaccharide deacetylase family protein, partial [Steroidobacteraceae bacterium]
MKRTVRRAVERAIAPLAPLAWRMRPAPRLLVLMYHRVLPANHEDRAIEQPGMYVSPATLDMHLRVLGEHLPLMHLDTWVARAAAGETLPPQACALTFDDGWRDNFDYAFPVLQHHKAPATIFLVSRMIDTTQDFWPNRLARLLVRLPSHAQLSEPLAGVLAPVLADARAAGAWDTVNLDRAIVLAKQLGEAQIGMALDAAPNQAVAGAMRAVLNREEIALMGASGLVRFGSHTRTHFRFRGTVAPDVLESEIGGSCEEIRAIAGSAASGVFCYPNGDTTEAAV